MLFEVVSGAGVGVFGALPLLGSWEGSIIHFLLGREAASVASEATCPSSPPLGRAGFNFFGAVLSSGGAQLTGPRLRARAGERF